MSRDITAPTTAVPSTYLDRLYKLIPSELTAAYAAIGSLIDVPVNGERYITVLVISFFVLLILVPIYMWRLQGVRSLTQLAISTISFPIWAANVSSILIGQELGIGGVTLGATLILWTLITPLLIKEQST